MILNLPVLTVALNRLGQRNNKNGGTKRQEAIFLQWQYGAEHADKGNEIGKVKLRSHISRAYKKKLPCPEKTAPGHKQSLKNGAA